MIFIIIIVMEEENIKEERKKKDGNIVISRSVWIMMDVWRRKRTRVNESNITLSAR